MIQEIEPEHLATVPIPDAPTAFKKKIHDLIVRSYELHDESNDLINQATALLIGELKLPDIGAFDGALLHEITFYRNQKEGLDILPVAFYNATSI